MRKVVDYILVWGSYIERIDRKLSVSVKEAIDIGFEPYGFPYTDSDGTYHFQAMVKYEEQKDIRL